MIFSRNVLLTGDYDRFNETNYGWHSLNVEEIIQINEIAGSKYYG